ncbi:MAG: glycosyltransferase family 9 protein [Candidatus Omnitrophica bacterium]|nr:glycosyltransferase family 9 protein [Candidatus Omnitrophota bacterium]
MKRILVVRNDRFGEFLLNIPAFRALKETFPQARLTAVTSLYVKELAQCIEYLDEVIVWDNLKHKIGEILNFTKSIKNKFDLCVIFNPTKEFHLISFLSKIPIRVGYNRKWGFLLTHKMEDKKFLGDKHEIEYNLDLVGLVGARTEDKSLSIKIDDDIIEELFKELNIQSKDTLVALHPWTSDPIKQWPYESFQKLTKRVAEEFKIKILIIGGEEGVVKSQHYFTGLGNNIINLTGKTTLKQLAVLLKKTQLLVSGDSGPIHLASCVDTPVVAIFRNDIPAKSALRWGPRSKGSIILEKPNLSDITVEEVFNKVKEVLER